MLFKCVFPSLSGQAPLARAGLEDKTPLAHQPEPLINSLDTPSPQWKGSVPQKEKYFALINSRSWPSISPLHYINIYMGGF